MVSNLRILSTPSSDTPSQCFPVVILHFDKARYVFNCPEGTVRSFGQHRIPYGAVRTTFLASTSSAASGGLPGMLFTLSDAGHRRLLIHGPIGLKYLIATMRTYVRRHNCQLDVVEVDPRPQSLPNEDGPAVDLKGKRPESPLQNGADVKGKRPESPPPPHNGTDIKGNRPESPQNSTSASRDPPASSSRTEDEQAPQPIYSDEYVDVFALQMRSQWYTVPPVPPNNDTRSSGTASELPQSDRQATTMPGQQTEEQGNGSSKRAKLSHQTSSTTNPPLFAENRFIPATMTPGSPQAQEWVSGIIRGMFFDALSSSRTVRFDKVPFFAWTKSLCAPPIGPSMIKMPNSDSPPDNITFTSQPAPPLLLSYVLQGKEQRGKFDPDVASVGHGVNPGYLFSVLASGKTAHIDRPKQWSEWPEGMRKAWIASQSKKRNANSANQNKKKNAKPAKEGSSPYNFDSVELEKVAVHSQDVVGPPRPGPVFVLLHVPSHSYVASLFTPANLQQLAPIFNRQADASTHNQPAIVIVHTAPPPVLKTDVYLSFISKFDPPAAENAPDVTHIIINEAFCADKLAFPSANLLHLRCSQLDEEIFQVPDYELEGSLGLDYLFDRQEEGRENWPAAWRNRTNIGFADMEVPLYPRPPGSKPHRNDHGAPDWNFYVGPRKEVQTEADREAARRTAAFGVPQDLGDAETSEANNGKIRLASFLAPPQKEPSQKAGLTEIEKKRQQAQQLKETAWQNFQSLASTIREELRTEKETEGDHMHSDTQRRRLSTEGKGIVITPLGTGSAMPSKYRNVSSTLIQLPRPPGVKDSEPAPCILLDAGEGTYGQLRRKFGPKGVEQILLGLKLLFISHVHADHHVGVTRLLIERRKLAHAARHPLFIMANHLVRSYLEEYNMCEPLGLADSSLGLAEWQEENAPNVRFGCSLTDYFQDPVSNLADVRKTNLAYLMQMEDLCGPKHVSRGEEGFQAWLAELSSRRWRVIEKHEQREVDLSVLPEPLLPGQAHRVLDAQDVKILAKQELPPAKELGTKDVWWTALKVLPPRLATSVMWRALMESLNLESCETVLVDHGSNYCYGLVLRQKANPQDLPKKTKTRRGRRSVSPESPPRGFSVAYSGDTRPCEAMVEASKDVTVMIHEATIQDGREEMAYAKGHSTFAQAIDIGRRSGAACTLLTHFSQRYPKLPRLTRRWQGQSGGGPNMKVGSDETEVFGKDAGGIVESEFPEEEEEEDDDDDAILNAMNQAEQSGIIKMKETPATTKQGGGGQAASSSSASASAPTLSDSKDAEVENAGMIIATAFDLASMAVPDIWKMERYVPALELLFDADEEDNAGDESMIANDGTAQVDSAHLD
ncbi:hypothetical protein A4X09_0g2031 [Tilletia walkeri]|uniref:ribonuclease Z n=1 Tax=Tilletia walkeri TaxID=117179 RepID=A0A8X7T674_9BASI|nr:hypothetical protein A4X09_0g2031 [Tilletia walkeri]